MCAFRLECLHSAVAPTAANSTTLHRLRPVHGAQTAWRRCVRLPAGMQEARMAVTEILIPLQQPVELLPHADSALQAQVRGTPRELRNGAPTTQFWRGWAFRGRHQKQHALGHGIGVCASVGGKVFPLHRV